MPDYTTHQQHNIVCHHAKVINWSGLHPDAYLECFVAVLQAEVIGLQVPAKLVLAAVHWSADGQAGCLLYKVVASFVVFIYILFMLTFWKEYKKITGESYSLKFTGISAKAATCLGIISLLALLYFTPKLERESKTLFKILGKTEFKSNNRILSRI